MSFNVFFTYILWMETEHWRMNFIINNKFDDDWWISLILYEKWVFMNDELSYVYFLLWNFLHMTLDQGSIFKNRLWFQKISIFLQKHFKISWICSKKIKIFLEICHCGKNLPQQKTILMTDVQHFCQLSRLFYTSLYTPKNNSANLGASKKQPSTMPIHHIRSNLMWTFWATIDNPFTHP